MLLDLLETIYTQGKQQMKTVAIFDALEPKGIVTIQQFNNELSRGETAVTFKDFYLALKRSYGAGYTR